MMMMKLLSINQSKLDTYFHSIVVGYSCLFRISRKRIMYGEVKLDRNNSNTNRHGLVNVVRSGQIYRYLARL